MNNKNSPNKETTDCITTGTKNESSKIECVDTNQKWKRECPVCHKIVIFKSYQGLWMANKHNSKCLHCNRIFLAKKMRESWPDGKNPFLGKNHTEAARKKCIEAAEKNAKYGKDNPFFGKKHDEKTKAFCISEAKRTAKFGKENPFYGKQHSEEVLEIIKKSQTGKKCLQEQMNTRRKYLRDLSASQNQKNTKKICLLLGKIE